MKHWTRFYYLSRKKEEFRLYESLCCLLFGWRHKCHDDVLEPRLKGMNVREQIFLCGSQLSLLQLQTSSLLLESDAAPSQGFSWWDWWNMCCLSGRRAATGLHHSGGWPGCWDPHHQRWAGKCYILILKSSCSAVRCRSVQQVSDQIISIKLLKTPTHRLNVENSSPNDNRPLICQTHNPPLHQALWRISLHKAWFMSDV